MKLSFNLLKQFIPIEMTAEELGGLLTERSFEVEGVVSYAPEFTNVVAAKVLTVEPHENADRLRVITLDAGNQIVSPVVCGAHNFDVGAIVALALPGAYIPKNIHSKEHEGFVLEKATIRGVESQGMICAGFELGLESKPGEGIILLDPNTVPGTDVTTIFPGDAILEVSIPANRPDLLSHMGVAREIAAITNAAYAHKKAKPLHDKGELLITIENPDECIVYHGAILSGFKTLQSPAWLVTALERLGFRSINAVVDITNYVMIEMGKPTHAFDADKITGGITVRRARAGETLEALDHKIRTLDEETLVIADDKEVIALAGVIGGLASEVTDQTHTVILESAFFTPETVRKTAKRYGIRTDASSRFEKGLYAEFAKEGIVRAIELITQVTGAKLIAFATVGGEETKLKSINYTAESINKLIGTSLTATEIKSYLSRYGITSKGSKSMTATPPIYRGDVQTPPDLADEVLKLHGINNLPITPLNIPLQGHTVHTESRFVRATKEYWARHGFYEVQNYSFVSEEEINRYGENSANYVAIENPLSSDQAFLRKHLDISMLRTILRNIHHEETVAIFEVGKEYHSYLNEPLILHASMASNAKSIESLLMELKGILTAYFSHFGINQVGFKNREGGIVEMMVSGIVLGKLFLTPAKIRRSFGIDTEIVNASLVLDKIHSLTKAITFEPISKHPSASRDISVVVNEGITWDQIESIIRSVSDLVAAVSPFEAAFLTDDKKQQKFHSELAEKGQKNLAIKVVFQAPDRTLEDTKIAGMYDQIVLKLQQELGAEIR
jgi:phenylalanyl-tRNA synthetase beta chain